ncbi:MAG TPA: 2-polyprenyl-3-methyl-6-methoxy-1,4-benzoquinone monooxygenase, partial [Gammaproteobacteria bacterium]
LHDDAARRHAAGLMRVNHAGEIAAQALYQGQSVFARNAEVRASMHASAQEEVDHLAWCEGRLAELGAGPSRLAPFWYAGSFTIGAFAGMAGDRWSLGFVAETERQVETHLESHLGEIPAEDLRSRAIIEQMKEDEIRHGAKAVAAGAADLPGPVREAMKLISKVMTTTAYYI